MRDRLIFSSAAALALAACGGGGGGGRSAPPVATPAPPPAPAPSPTPTPAPPPVPNADSPEYRATVGAVSMNALAAYNRGASGAGVSVAVIDSGLDVQSEEFAGRVSSASQDLTAARGIDDEGGHGTAVSFTLAGRRNGAGTHGVAFDATLIALRADRPGSCDPNALDNDGCAYPTSAIARGVDIAREAGARVINMSLGGEAMPADLRAAIGRATAAGLVIVISAGNEAEAEPDPFALVALDAAVARGQVIIAGSVGEGGAISSFSDRAGSASAQYLAAVGERVRAPDEAGTAFLWSGTSFSAPQISGAAALLAQAFPNLTGAQIVEILLSTARDAGAPGTDAVYGRGVLDLTRAFQPAGATTVAGSAAAVSTAANGVLSAPMGDTRGLSAGAVILDGYSRAFAIDLARTVTRARPVSNLTGTLANRARSVAMAAGGMSMAVTIAPRGPGRTDLRHAALTASDAQAARAIAGSVTQRLGARTAFGFGFATGGQAVAAQLAGAAEPAFLVANAGGLGFDSRAASSAAYRQRFGGWGVTLAAEAGDVLHRREEERAGLSYWRRAGYDRVALGLDRRFGPVAASLTGSRLVERATMLGARLGPAFGSPRGVSWFIDAGARVEPGGGWTVGGTMRQGWTRARLTGIEGGGAIRSTAWSVDVGRDGAFVGSDSLGLRLAQPLRVSGGGFGLMLPTNWSYAANAVDAWTTQRLDLTPSGRELDLEARYALPLGPGEFQTNLFWRRDPGHFADLPDDLGVAIRYGFSF
jgi:subtilisin family serine protease